MSTMHWICKFKTKFVTCAFLIFVIGCKSTSHPEDGVNEYVSNLYPGWTLEGSNIVDYDSNGDGYVSAEIRIINPKSKQERLICLSCAKNCANGSGCITLLKQ